MRPANDHLEATMRRTLPLVLALTLAGCASSPSTAPPAATTAASSSGPTVTQFASVVAKTKAELSGLDLTDCAFPTGIQATTCALVVKTAPLKAQVAARDMRAIGTPPAEITTLVANTLEALDGLAAEDVTPCEQPEDAGCWGTMARVRNDIDRTIEGLAAWDPYS